MARFGQVVTAMVTPVRRPGRRRSRGRRRAGVAGWSTGATTGWCSPAARARRSTLSDDEQVEVWRAVRDAVDVPLVAGSGTNDTRHAAELTAQAAAAGMDGVLVVTPYYNRPSQAGLEAHFRAVAAATELPVLLYDIPIRSSRRDHPGGHLAPRRGGAQHRRRSRTPLGNPSESARLMAQAPDGFELYSGDDAFTLPLLAVGAVGVISVAAHWAGPRDGRDDRLVRQGRRRGGPGGQRPAHRVLRLRERRPHPQPAADQGPAAGPGPARRPVPPADG